jgi:hypothetical protein
MELSGRTQSLASLTVRRLNSGQMLDMQAVISPSDLQ